MFTFSLKASKNRIIALSISLILLLIVIFFALNSCSKQTYASTPNGKYSLYAKDGSSRVYFLSQFGWEVPSDPIEISDIKIPQVFNSTYEDYNNIQKSQGLNLEKHKGKCCKRYSYQVLNYSGKPSGVRANIVVLDNYVIGGDISSVELSGFMHGFDNPNKDVLKQTNNIIASKPESSIPIPTKETKSTQRQTLAPDPQMPNAPTD